MSRARTVAREVVSRVRERSAYAHETLDSVLKSARLDPRDTAFATRLAYGTVACRGTLDEAIDRHLTNPGSLEPLVRDSLVVSAYELLFAATPGRAAVSEGVEMVRSVQPRAAGLANAVLRRLAEEADRFPWGDPARDNKALATLYGHPRWLAEMWISELGRETARSIMAADNEPAPLYLAHIPGRGTIDAAMESLSAAGAEPELCELEGCLVAHKPAAAIRSEALASHTIAVIDAAAQMAVRAVGISAGETVAEIGAGRGGKTLLLAARAAADAGDSGVSARIVAIDNRQFKLDALLKAAEQAGIPGIEIMVADATEPADLAVLQGGMDAVLVDAPCSGLGTLRRHPDRRWRATYDDVETLGLLGEKLLTSASRLVKPGGFVVYSTCTIARRENSDVIERFLGSPAGAGFSVDSLASDIPAPWTRFLSEDGTFQSLPEIGGMDGHFVARLKRDRQDTANEGSPCAYDQDCRDAGGHRGRSARCGSVDGQG